MTEDRQTPDPVHIKEAGIVAGLLLDTLRKELNALKRKGKYEHLIEALSHGGMIGDMISPLARTVPGDLAAIIRETSMKLDHELPRIEHDSGQLIIDSDQALTNISTTLETIQWLVRIFKILRTNFAAIVKQDHTVEGCAALACVTYGRLLEVIGLKEASYDSALNLRKDVIRALTSEVRPTQ